MNQSITHGGSMTTGEAFWQQQQQRSLASSTVPPRSEQPMDQTALGARSKSNRHTPRPAVVFSSKTYVSVRIITVCGVWYRLWPNFA